MNNEDMILSTLQILMDEVAKIKNETAVGRQVEGGGGGNGDSGDSGAEALEQAKAYVDAAIAPVTANVTAVSNDITANKASIKQNKTAIQGINMDLTSFYNDVAGIRYDVKSLASVTVQSISDFPDLTKITHSGIVIAIDDTVITSTKTDGYTVVAFPDTYPVAHVPQAQAKMIVAYCDYASKNVYVLASLGSAIS